MPASTLCSSRTFKSCVRAQARKTPNAGRPAGRQVISNRLQILSSRKRGKNGSLQYEGRHAGPRGSGWEHMD